MALLNQAIASLFNGVSQQPSQLRLSSQCELSENYYPTIATGLAKRPPTFYKAKLSSSTNTSAYTTVINRDTSERYVLMLRNGSLEVFDAFTGAAKTVAFPDGTSYLTSSNPLKDFSAVTVADYTFIVNRSKTVGTLPTVAPSNPNVGYVVVTYSGAGVQRVMSIIADGVGATWSGANNDIGASITHLTTVLGAGLGAGWSVTNPFGNIIRIERLGSSTPWALTVEDTYGGATMRVVKDAVQLFSDLPTQVDDGYICYITSRPDDPGKGYYVRYDASQKSYIECPKPGTLTSLDPTTMPHKLVRESDGTFTFAKLDWNQRTVGDDISNPWPTFVGRSINDVFFYRNRLGFLADENVVLSTSGEYFNFFAKTVTAVLDADPIDEAVANTKVSILRFAVPFNKALLLFADQTQFQLSAQDILSPKTVRADPVTEFVSSPICRPVGAGQSLYFVTDKPNSSGIREYAVEQDTMANDAADITAHVPAYLPTGVFKLSVSTSEDCLMALSTQERNAIYAYKFYWGPQEKVQSAWFKWVLESGDVLMGAEFIGPTALLIIGRSDGIYLEAISLQPGVVDSGLPFEAHLDRKVSLTGTYNSGTNTTTWTLPYPHDGTVEAVLGAAFGTRAGASFTLTPGTGTTVSALGDWSAGPAIIGLRYTARFRFSEQHLKDANNQVIASATIKIRRMFVSYTSTGYFRAEVTPPGRATNTYPFTGKTLGVSGVKLGTPTLSSGTARFPVMAASKGVRIDLVNDTPFPSSFQSAEWEGEVVVQAKR